MRGPDVQYGCVTLLASPEGAAACPLSGGPAPRLRDGTPRGGGFRGSFRDTVHLTERQDVGTFEDGDVVDLGGRTLTVLHLPEHTAGHCGLLVEPDVLLFLADIDITSSGPYHGDLSSSPEDCEASITVCGR